LPNKTKRLPNTKQIRKTERQLLKRLEKVLKMTR